MISEEELTLVLKALRADGIRVEKLAFDNEQVRLSLPLLIFCFPLIDSK
jgi:hypothetical protein